MPACRPPERTHPRRRTPGVVAVAMSLAALCGTLSAQQTGAPGWRLVYAADTAGTAAVGDKAHLLAAVRAGLPVRVGWRIPWRTPDGTTGALEHFAEASFLTIHHGEVFAQIEPILGQVPSAQQPRITFRTEGERLWYALLDTTGRLHHYFAGGSEAQTTRTATSWYVDSRTEAEQRGRR